MKLEETELYLALSAKAQTPQVLPLNGGALLSLVGTASHKFGQVLNRTCVNFEKYTLHDEQHAVRVVFIMARLLGAETLAKLSAVDLALLILAAFGHDLGMAIGEEDRTHLQKSEGYKQFLLANEDQWLEAEQAKERKQDDRFQHLSSLLFQN